MKNPSAVMTLAVLTAGCGAPREAPVDRAPVAWTEMRPVDSIGVLEGDSLRMFGQIVDIAPVPGGGVAVLDFVTAKVSLFDGEGCFTGAFGGRGEAPGEFQHPKNITVLPDGDVVVTEMLTGAVTLTDREGRFLSRWCHEGLGSMPLLMIPFDDSSFVDYRFSMGMGYDGFTVGFGLSRYHAATGEKLAALVSWSGPARPDTDFEPGYLCAAGDAGRGVIYLSRCNAETWMIEVMDGAGNPVDTMAPFPGRTRVPASEGEPVPGAYMVSFMYADESGSSGNMFTNAPGLHPFIGALGVDREGNVWARRGGPGDPVWDVVSPVGEPLREVTVHMGDPYSVPDLVMGDGGFFMFQRNPQDYCRVYIMEESAPL